MSKAATSKPAKPYPEFPLTAHPNGQWVKKIKGQLHYFGPWADPEAALNLYLDQRDDLFAGRKPRQPNDNSPTLGFALNEFLSVKKLALEKGELSQRSYNEYEAACDRIASVLGAKCPLNGIGASDLARVRAACWQGKNGKVGATSAKGHLTRTRMVFLFINEELDLAKPIRYRNALKSPSRKEFRKLANERGPRMFDAAEICEMLAEATPQIKPMIYLGINCGFGNNDCATFPRSQLDLKNGWHNYPRPKTHNPRRCPLWPETVEAIKAAIAERPGCDGLVFITKYGNSWADTDSDRNNPIAYEFRKLLKELGIYRKNVTGFYGLRRSFATIGATAGEQNAVNYIMGHIASDMPSHYRQKTFDAQLRKVTDHVRDWLLGRVTLD